MSKTFGQLRAGDEVYIIKGSDVEIVKVQSTEVAIRQYVLITIGDTEYSLPIDLSSFYDDMFGDIYCDIDEAMRTMQDICAKAWHDYREASGALNKLETKKKENEKRGNKKDNNE